MRKVCKLVSVLFIMFILLSALTGCATQNKMELMNAFEKTNDIRSYESHSSFEIQSITLDSTIMKAEAFEPLVSMLNGLKMDIHQKVSQNNEQTILKAQLDMAATLQGITEQTSIWIDNDFTEESPRMKFIIKIPTSAAGTFVETDEEKEYFVMDSSILEDTGGIAPEIYSETLESAKNFQTQILNLIKQYAIDKDPDFVVVTQLPNRTINGEKHNVYQLRLTDASLKALLKYIAAEMPHNDVTKEMLKEFILTAMIMTEGTEAGMDLNDTFRKFRDGTTTFSQDLNKTLETFDDITLLGDQGIVIDYVVNSQGYIISQNGTIDLYINTQQLDDALEKLSPSGNYPESNKSEFLQAVATFSLKFNSKVSRINENIIIEFPTLTPENSMDFNDIDTLTSASARALKQQAGNKNISAMPQITQASTNAIKYNIKPIIIGKHVILPLEDVCKNLRIAYKKNKDDTYSIIYDKRNICFSSNSNKITVNKASAVLNLPVMSIENRLLVPQEFVERYLDVSIILNKKDNTVAIFRKNN